MPRCFFPVPELDELPSALQTLFRKAVQEIGFLPNVFQAYAWRPDRFSAWFTHYRLLTEPTATLTAADREMIAVVVSHINSCTYCLVSHGHGLRAELRDGALADRIAINWRHADLDDRQWAICAYADKLTRTPAEIGPDDLESLRNAGLSDIDIWDVVELAAMYSFTNRVSLAMGTVPNPEYHWQHRDEPGR